MLFIKIWIWFFSISLFLLPFRSDARILFIEISSMLFSNRLSGFVFSVILLFIFLPIVIPYSLINIINKNKK